jgi:hypothetical protein
MIKSDQHYLKEVQDLACRWWSSLSINEMKALEKKHGTIFGRAMPQEIAAIHELEDFPTCEQFARTLAARNHATVNVRETLNMIEVEIETPLGQVWKETETAGIKASGEKGWVWWRLARVMERGTRFVIIGGKK